MKLSSKSNAGSTADAHRRRGFTLIELMITVAIIAILAAIAYPSYQGQVRKSRRSAAQGVLLDVASREQQLYLDSRQYVAAADTAALASSALRVTVQSNLTNSYSFVVTLNSPANAPPEFTVTATPQGNQALDNCGIMTIDQVGAKTPSTSGCW